MLSIIFFHTIGFITGVKHCRTMHLQVASLFTVIITEFATSHNACRPTFREAVTKPFRLHDLLKNHSQEECICLHYFLWRIPASLKWLTV